MQVLLVLPYAMGYSKSHYIACNKRRSDRNWNLETLIDSADRALSDYVIHQGLSVNRADEIMRERERERAREKELSFFPFQLSM
jgi:hypothetical protein